MRLSRWLAVVSFVGSANLGHGQEQKNPPPAQPDGDRVARPQTAGPDGAATEEASVAARIARLERMLKDLEAKAKEKGERKTAKRRLVTPGEESGYYMLPWYPWYCVPQTYYPSRKDYGPSIEYRPRLGLGSIYQGASQMGIHVPRDSDLLDFPPNLGEFQGVVGTAKAELAAEAEGAANAEAAGTAPSGPGASAPPVPPSDDEALKLMKAGQYKEAGKLAAARFQQAQTPHDALVLVEAFFALGKFDTAKTLLENALGMEGVSQALPDDVASHFPSREEFEKKLQDLSSAGDYGYLTQYLMLHSSHSEEALSTLGKLSGSEGWASTLWRRYLSKAFK